MTRITDMIWIGDSKDERRADLNADSISAILNVAHDLHGTRGWFNGVLYSQCGLVDGPGSTLAAYHSAVLQLLSLVAGGRRTLVVDHDGRSRAMAVVIMALHAGERLGWEHWRAYVAEQLGVPDYEPHPEHKAVFSRMSWRLMMSVIEG